jgi:23S rRNA (adenine2503-C2)-methyltransferase
MGMGEPLMNYNNVMKAVDKITDPETIGMSPKRITISTSGVSKMIKKMADDQVRCNLAVSLHSAIEEVRNKIMPFTRKFPLEELKEAIAYWYEKTGSRVTYEYVVWKGINDQQEDVNALVDFCKTTPSKVNLIEYNPTDNPHFLQADTAAINRYINTLERNRIPVTVRRSRGKDIDAACGQLANKKAPTA